MSPLSFGLDNTFTVPKDSSSETATDRFPKKLPGELTYCSTVRLGLGNFSNVKGVGGGVYECRVNFGLGFRIYLGKDGERLVILLAGGTKKRQQKDIEDARA